MRRPSPRRAYDWRVTFKPRIVPPAPEPPSEKVRRRVRAMPRPATLMQCRCGGRELIETRTGVLLKNGKPTGGDRQYLCAMCFMRGERVVVT